MPRVSNKVQKSYEFSHIIEICDDDINIGGHVGNTQMIDLTHDARLSMFKELGIVDLDLGDGKTGIVVADISANYKAEVFLNDVLDIKCHIGEMSDKSFRMFHCLEKKGHVAALIEIGFVAFDFKDRNVTSIPDVFKKRLADYLKQC